ncbi:DUF2789 domain-containing protein [Arsukibacterium indicum]|uniref:DUF2789 domain-containing protein n=1 Tax=Arsukibacterium indicum TaxID=2848612 RepID=A0ABS6MHD5_9GAMM|nr:DUF2789 domain-containing protein [Arsukibacterium indicum]MBV2128233.1 DUF2789 domain-containing protein [Arsukibacterium indicum]
MDTSNHNMANLFMQLGLDNKPDAIKSFISRHKLPGHVALADAPFWSAAQASFIRESLKEDADWAEIIDELNTQLR